MSAYGDLTASDWTSDVCRGGLLERRAELLAI